MELKEKIIKSFYDKPTLITFIIVLALFFIIVDTLMTGPGFTRVGFPFNYRTADTNFPNSPQEFHPELLIANLAIYYLISIVISFLIKRNK
jgi:hypothetical protein